MSYNLLPLDNQEAIPNLPSLGRIQNTLLFIETIKSLPNHSLTCLGHVEQNINDEDSLGERIKEQEKQISIKIDNPENKRKKNGCTCKKTQCLKMYCQCFALGKVCTPECACYSCFNTNDYTDLIQKARLGIKCKSSRKNTQGCTCKKSQCQKKYCECFNAGVACTSSCKCTDCQNHTPHSCSDHHHSQIAQQINEVVGGEESLYRQSKLLQTVNPQNQQQIDLNLNQNGNGISKCNSDKQDWRNKTPSTKIQSFNSLDLINYIN